MIEWVTYRELAAIRILQDEGGGAVDDDTGGAERVSREVTFPCARLSAVRKATAGSSYRSSAGASQSTSRVEKW